GAALAHGLHMSQIRLRLDGARAEGEWEIQVPDARLAFGQGPPAGLAQKLTLTADGAPCPVEIGAMTERGQGPQAVGVFALAARGRAEPVHLGLRCDLLFDLDAGHRAYFSVEDARVTHAGVLRADRRAVTLDIHHFRALEIIGELVREGVWHIWTGL